MLIPQYNGVCDVTKVFQYYFKTLTNKVAELIRFKKLPDHIDEEFLKESLILEGRVCFTEFNSHIYALTGNVGGEVDCYKVPTYFIIANPVLGSRDVKVRHIDGSTSVDGLEGIVVGLTHVDTELSLNTARGLYNLIYNYAGMLADNFVSLNCAQINSRVQVAYVADNQNLANTAETVLKDLYNGKPYKVLSQDILNKLTVSPVAASGANTTIISLIEAHATILADFWSELGIAYNSNRKRQYVGQAEASMDTGSLNLNIDSIINSIKDGIERVNDLFGTDIEVEIDENAYENVMNGEAELADTDNTEGIVDKADDEIKDNVEAEGGKDDGFEEDKSKKTDDKED